MLPLAGRGMGERRQPQPENLVDEVDSSLSNLVKQLRKLKNSCGLNWIYFDLSYTTYDPFHIRGKLFCIYRSFLLFPFLPDRELLLGELAFLAFQNYMFVRFWGSTFGAIRVKGGDVGVTTSRINFNINCVDLVSL